MAEHEDMNAMGERPPMPDMQGANMPNPMRQMPREAIQRLMQPSQEIGAVLMARISVMTPEELRMLDSAISPEVSRVLVKLLPELAQIIEPIVMQQQQANQPSPQREMGALGRMR